MCCINTLIMHPRQNTCHNLLFIKHPNRTVILKEKFKNYKIISIYHYLYSDAIVTQVLDELGVEVGDKVRMKWILCYHT